MNNIANLPIMPAVQMYEFHDSLNNRMVEFRALTMIEEKIWISAKDGAYENKVSKDHKTGKTKQTVELKPGGYKKLIDAIGNIVSACTFNVIPATAPPCLIEYAFINIHIESKAKIIDIQYTCNALVEGDQDHEDYTCGHKQSMDIDLSNTVLTIPENHSSKYIFMKTSEKKKLGVSFKYQKLDIITEFQKVKNLKSLDGLIGLAVDHIEYFYTEEDGIIELNKEQKIAFVELLSSKQRDKLFKFFITQPYTALELDAKCDKCGIEDKILIRGVSSFLE